MTKEIAIIAIKNRIARLKNSEKNLNKYNFVDSYTLLRASLEYIVMSYMIEVEEKTYNEFLILSNNDIQLKRKFTVPNTLLKKFGKRLNKISNNLLFHIKYPDTIKKNSTLKNPNLNELFPSA